MKNIIYAILLAASICQAETLATSPNQSGGLFVLTDVKCTKKPGLIAYTTSPDNPTAFGCWFVDDNFVHINWDNVGVRSYDFSNWTAAKKKEKRYD